MKLEDPECMTGAEKLISIFALVVLHNAGIIITIPSVL